MSNPQPHPNKKPYRKRRLLAGAVSRDVARRALVATIVLASGFAPACRDTEPPPVLYVDLGDADRPLPPPAASTWVDPAVKNGRAEWHPFREPSLEAMTTDQAEAVAEHEQGHENGSPLSDAQAKQIIAEIREMIDEYNAVAAEGKTDELVDFYVLSQTETIGPMLNLQATVIEKLGAIEQALLAKLPDQAERIKKVFASLRKSDNTLKLEVGDIKVESDHRATGVLQGAPTPVQITFVLEEDAWYIELPPELLTMIQMTSSMIGPTLDQLQSGIESGQVPPEQILAALEQSVAMIQQQAAGSSAPQGE